MGTRIVAKHKDAMAFWNDDLGTYLHDPSAAHDVTFLYEVPDAWLADGAFTPDGLRCFHDHIYGPTWRAGNGDGSMYVPLSTQVEVVGADDPRSFKRVG